MEAFKGKQLSKLTWIVFESLGVINIRADGSGWTWLIPLHNGTTSVEVVMKKHLATSKKKASGPISCQDFYAQCLRGSPGTWRICIGLVLQRFGLFQPLRASGRGCWMFYWPALLWSPGNQQRRRQSVLLDGEAVLKSFLLVVTGTLGQIYDRNEHLLDELNEQGFDRAF